MNAYNIHLLNHKETITVICFMIHCVASSIEDAERVKAWLSPNGSSFLQHLKMRCKISYVQGFLMWELQCNGKEDLNVKTSRVLVFICTGWLTVVIGNGWCVLYQWCVDTVDRGKWKQKRMALDKWTRAQFGWHIHELGETDGRLIWEFIYLFVVYENGLWPSIFLYAIILTIFFIASVTIANILIYILTRHISPLFASSSRMHTILFIWGCNSIQAQS